MAGSLHMAVIQISLLKEKHTAVNFQLKAELTQS